MEESWKTLGTCRELRVCRSRTVGASGPARLARARCGDPQSSTSASDRMPPEQKKSVASALLGVLGSRRDAPETFEGEHQPAAGEGQLENHLGGDEARNYRQYEYDMVAPHVGKSLLEVGSGLGHFSEQFLGKLSFLAVSDNDPYCVGELEKRYADDERVEVLSLALPADIK